MEVTQNLVNQIMMLYDKKYDADIFNFDMLTGPHIYQIVPPQIVEHIHQYIINPKYSGDTGKKIAYIDKVLKPYGLVRFAAGTNRAVYKYMEDQSFCVKVALDKTGITNNPDEFKNQQFLKPFVNKIFSVSACGTFATCERVVPIRSRQEFAAVAGDIFDVIAKKFIGKYLLEDIGTIWFKNWGIRGGFGPVLLDYPYLYEVNINQLFCNEMTPLGLPCGGQIDYDTGFNILYCTRCGKRHKAKQIGKAIHEKLIMYKGGNGMSFKIVVKKGNEVIVDKTRADNHIDPKEVLASKNSSTTISRVIPKNDNRWRNEDFDLILTIKGIKYGKKGNEYVKLGESKAKAAVKTVGAKENPYKGVIANIKPKQEVQPNMDPPTWFSTEGQANNINQNAPRKVTVDMSCFKTRPSKVSVPSTSGNMNFGVKIIKNAPVVDETKAAAEREEMIRKAKEIQFSIDKDLSIKANTPEKEIEFTATPITDKRIEDEAAKLLENLSSGGFIDNSHTKTAEEATTEKTQESTSPVSEGTVDNVEDIADADCIKKEVEAFHLEETAATIKHFGLNAEDFERSTDANSQEAANDSEQGNYDVPDIADF